MTKAVHSPRTLRPLGLAAPRPPRALHCEPLPERSAPRKPPPRARLSLALSLALHALVLPILLAAIPSRQNPVGDVDGTEATPDVAAAITMLPPTESGETEPPLPEPEPPRLPPPPPPERSLIAGFGDLPDLPPVEPAASDPDAPPAIDVAALEPWPEPEAPPKPVKKQAAPPKKSPKPRATGSGQATSRAQVRVTPPRPLSTREPAYPPAARKAGKQGTALVRVAVSAGGRIQGVQIHRSSGDGALDSAALACVRRWKFAPAHRGDEPVAAPALVSVTFRIAG